MAGSGVNLGSDPSYAAAKAKHTELQSEVARLERRIGEIERAILRSGTERLGDDAALALLDGSATGDDADVTTLRGELGRVRADLAVHRRAVELQRGRVDAARSEASAAVCERLAPKHRKIVADLARTLIAAGEAALVEIEFREELFEADVSFAGRLRPMPTALGDPRDRDSALASWLREAVEFGLIEPGAIPADWRKKWNV